MTHDYQNRRHWRYPRSMREVFGHDLQPLRRSLIFRTCQRSGLCGIAVAILLIAAAILIGEKP